MTQLSIFDLQKNNEPAPARSQVRSKDLFDCCSRYRECSDAKKCLIADADYSNACNYRRKLESGTVLFGKNANKFDKTVYADILKKHKRLNNSERVLLVNLIKRFYNFGDELFMNDSPELRQIENCGLISCYNPPKDKIINRINFKILRSFLSEDVKKELCERRRAAVQNPKAMIVRADVVDWLMSHDCPEFDEYLKQFVFVYVGENMQPYLVEICRDYILK